MTEITREGVEALAERIALRALFGNPEHKPQLGRETVIFGASVDGVAEAAAIELRAARASAPPPSAAAEVETLREALREIGDYAHDRSSGPTVPDALWEIREMAYAPLRSDDAALSGAPAPEDGSGR